MTFGDDPQGGRGTVTKFSIGLRLVRSFSSGGRSCDGRLENRCASSNKASPVACNSKGRGEKRESRGSLPPRPRGIPLPHPMKRLNGICPRMLGIRKRDHEQQNPCISPKSSADTVPTQRSEGTSLTVQARGNKSQGDVAAAIPADSNRTGTSSNGSPSPTRSVWTSSTNQSPKNTSCIRSVCSLTHDRIPRSPLASYDNNALHMLAPPRLDAGCPGLNHGNNNNNDRNSDNDSDSWHSCRSCATDDADGMSHSTCSDLSFDEPPVQRLYNEMDRIRASNKRCSKEQKEQIKREHSYRRRKSHFVPPEFITFEAKSDDEEEELARIEI